MSTDNGSESPETERRRARVMAEFMWGGFVHCPTTGRVIEFLQGDDKVLCRCGQSNPRVPEEHTEQTGVHIVRFCQPATTDEYLDQREREWKRG